MRSLVLWHSHLGPKILEVQGPGLHFIISSSMVHKTQSGRTLSWTLRKRDLHAPGCPLAPLYMKQETQQPACLSVSHIILGTTSETASALSLPATRRTILLCLVLMLRLELSYGNDAFYFLMQVSMHYCYIHSRMCHI
jgi:hypothetical protein